MSEKKNEYRFERKFVYRDINEKYLLYLIKKNPACFKEIFYERTINNIYFDDQNMNNFWANIDGLSYRVKPRIRWYGNNLREVENPLLEFKIKNGPLGFKEYFKLENFQIGEIFNSLKQQALFSGLPQNKEHCVLLRNMIPTVINSYKRRYFQSFDRKFRITIDKDIKYYSADDKLKEIPYDSKCYIIEVKYNEEDNTEAGRVINGLDLTLGKNSKYVNGVFKFEY